MVTKSTKLAFILGAVLVVVAFVTVNTLAVAKHEDGWRALSATGTILRSSHLSLAY
jgi:hypothetical protein